MADEQKRWMNWDTEDEVGAEWSLNEEVSGLLISTQISSEMLLFLKWTLTAKGPETALMVLSHLRTDLVPTSVIS